MSVAAATLTEPIAAEIRPEAEVARPVDRAARRPSAEQPESGGRGKKPRLGERLIGAGLISPDELTTALEKQSQNQLRIGEILLELGLIREDELLPFMEEQLGVHAVRIREGLVDPQVVHRIPREFAERWNVLALLVVRGELCVATDDPHNLLMLDELERVTRLKVRPAFAFASSIERMVSRCYDQRYAVDAVTADMDESAVTVDNDLADADITSIEELVEGSPVINLVNYLILQAYRKGASDIHIERDRKFSVVRYRLDGQLVEVLRPRRDFHAALISRIKVMGKMDIAEQHIPQDGRCRVVVEGRQIDLRISTLPTVLGEKAVLRVLDKSRLTFDLEKLGLPGDNLVDVKKLLAKPYGLLLVTGPTGSGKTTTLYSALELIKSVHRNIVTIEDPVEYQIELVNQVQVDTARSLTFATVLRSILRQDPDVVMVGEIRDAETAKLAVQAALTGHLVLSTLHTNDAAGAVTRLTDMGIESYKVAAALVGVVAQRLLRKICPKCRAVYYPSAEVLDGLNYQGDRRRTFVRGEGCSECFDTGFQGRTGIYEVLTVGPELREMISAGADLERIRQWFGRHGGRSLLDSGIRLAEQETTSLDEVARFAFVDS
jgi:type IV pilus assembly protein PilB